MMLRHGSIYFVSLRITAPVSLRMLLSGKIYSGLKNHHEITHASIFKHELKNVFISPVFLCLQLSFSGQMESSLEMLLASSTTNRQIRRLTEVNYTVIII